MVEQCSRKMLVQDLTLDTIVTSTAFKGVLRPFRQVRHPNRPESFAANVASSHSHYVRLNARCQFFLSAQPLPYLSRSGVRLALHDDLMARLQPCDWRVC